VTCAAYPSVVSTEGMYLRDGIGRRLLSRPPRIAVAGLLSELLGPGAWHEVILTGGAARSRLWPQILADVIGFRVSVPEHTESAARGAAILAGRAAGVLPEDPPPPGPQPDDPGQAVPGRERATRPSLASQRAYDQLYARWRPAGPRCGGGPGFPSPRSISDI
jgi:FGGY family of carbohydrate kinases, C-terminal domain